MWTSAFVSPGYLPRSGVAGSCDDCVSLVLDELPGQLQSSCTSLQPHQPCVRVCVVFQHLIITRVSLLKMDSSLPLERSSLAGWSQLPSTWRRVDSCYPPPPPPQSRLPSTSLMVYPPGGRDVCLNLLSSLSPLPFQTWSR